MPDVQVAVGLRRETGVHGVVDALGKVFFDLYLNKVFGNSRIFHNRVLLV